MRVCVLLWMHEDGLQIVGATLTILILGECLICSVGSCYEDPIPVANARAKESTIIRSWITDIAAEKKARFSPTPTEVFHLKRA